MQCLFFFLCVHSKPAIQRTVKLCFPAGGEELAGLERRTAGSADGWSRLSLGRNGCISPISQINLAFSPLSVHQRGSGVTLKGIGVSFQTETLHTANGRSPHSQQHRCISIRIFQILKVDGQIVNRFHSGFSRKAASHLSHRTSCPSKKHLLFDGNSFTSITDTDVM